MRRAGTRRHKKQRWKRIFAMLAALFSFFALCTPCLAAGGSAPKAVVDAKQGVVRIFCSGVQYYQNGYSYEYVSTGSGFYIGETNGEQYFLTNHHVVSEDYDGTDCDEIYILLHEHAITEHYQWGTDDWDFTSYDRNDEDAIVRCEVVYKTTGYPDFAIIKAERKIEGLVPLRLSRAENIQDGTAVYAIGYPGSSDYFEREITGSQTSVVDLPAGVKASTLTPGMVSRFIESELVQGTWLIQHTASINHGNSGGPLVISNGAVVGINTYGVEEHSLAIFIDYATQKLDELSIRYRPYNDWTVLALPGVVCGLVAAALLLFVRYSKRPAKRSPPNLAALRLQCVSGTFAPRRFAIQNPTRIGRDPRRNDLVYPPDAAKISGTHCQLLFEDGKLYLEDLNSMNGTYRNGVKLPVMQKVPLEVGNVFSLGKDNAETFRIEVSGKR